VIQEDLWLGVLEPIFEDQVVRINDEALFDGVTAIKVAA
jgi:hypothetical protein